MADSYVTKSALAKALKQLVIEKQFEKIGIAEICDICDMNRKSFYYHFRDKYELVIWIFEQEFSQIYKNQKVISIWDTTALLCSYFYENKSFYKKRLKVNGQNSFADYFAALCSDALKERLKWHLDGITITDMNVKTYTDFFVFSIYVWLTSHDTRDDKAFMRDLKNSVVFGAELARIFSVHQSKTETEEKETVLSLFSKH